VRLDWEIARRGYRRYAAYPAATVAGAFTNVVFGFMRGYILLALYRHRHLVGGYDTSDTLTYTWLTQGLIATVYIWGWQELALRIRSGDVATDLGRPVDPLRAGLAASPRLSSARSSSTSRRRRARSSGSRSASASRWRSRSRTRGGSSTTPPRSGSCTTAARL
jgi:hypothetical protein